MLTTEQKIQAYSSARDAILKQIEEDRVTGVCPLLFNYLLWHVGSHFNVSDLPSHFPEFFAYGPKDHFQLWWWSNDEDGQRERVRILESILSTLKNQ